ncbi:MAG: dephospho-CoA kinase [Armatimonadota bacterium]
MVVGLTGGIGTGKSTALRIFSKMGADVMSADEVAREIVKKGESAYNEIIDVFGETILDENKEVDRKALAKIVFSDVSARKKLEDITHPKIMKKMMDFAESYRKNKKNSSRIAILEIPLLYECKFDVQVEKVIVVSSEQETSIGRLTKERGLSDEDVKARINSQMPIEQKEDMADFVIKNNGSLEKLESEVSIVWGKLLEMVG